MHTLPIRILILSIAMLVLLALGIYALSLLASNDSASNDSAQMPTLSDAIRNGTAPIPQLSASTKDKLAESRGFQALVSYTDNGFEPASISIKAGETVRFTNNSSHDVWITTSGGLYPAARNGCGPSALDSCAPFAPQDFWEFTFDAAGEWGYVNATDKTKTGVVHVQ